MDEFWNQSKHDIRTNIYYMFLVNSVVPTAANSANPKPVSRSIAKRVSLFHGSWELMVKAYMPPIWVFVTWPIFRLFFQYPLGVLCVVICTFEYRRFMTLLTL